MINKERWQKLAGIVPTDASNIAEGDKKKLKAELSEGFQNLGMVSPGIMGGNPFEGTSTVTKEQHDDYGDLPDEWRRRPEEDLSEAMDLLHKVVEEASTGPFHGVGEGSEQVSAELIDNIKHFLKDN